MLAAAVSKLSPTAAVYGNSGCNWGSPHIAGFWDPQQTYRKTVIYKQNDLFIIDKCKSLQLTAYNKLTLNKSNHKI
jgi:hypothetical protein